MIDVHAHAVFEMVMGAAGPHGPELYDVDGEPRFRAGGYELCNVRYRGSVFMEPATAYLAERATSDEAVETIASRYLALIREWKSRERQP